MTTAAPVALRSTAPRPTLGFLIVLPLLLSFAAPVAENAYAQEPVTGDTPEAIWSDDYINMIWHLPTTTFSSSSSTTLTRR